MRKLKNRFMSTQTGGEGETIQSQPEITTATEELIQNVTPASQQGNQNAIPENIQPIDVSQQEQVQVDSEPMQAEIQQPIADETTPPIQRTSASDLVTRDEKPIEGLNVKDSSLPTNILNDDGTQEDIMVPSYQSSIPTLTVPDFSLSGKAEIYGKVEELIPVFRTSSEKREYEKRKELEKFSGSVVEYFDEVDKKEAQKSDQIKRNNEILKGTQPKTTSYDKIANEVSVSGFVDVEEEREFKDIKYAPSANMQTFMSLFNLNEDEITKIAESTAGQESLRKVQDYSNIMNGYSTELEYVDNLENILKSGKSDKSINLKYTSGVGFGNRNLISGAITPEQKNLIKNEIATAKKIANDFKTSLDNFENDNKLDPKKYDEGDKNKQTDLYSKFEAQTEKKLKNLYGTQWKMVTLETYGGDKKVRYIVPGYGSFDVTGSAGPGEAPQYTTLEDVKKVKSYAKWLDNEGKKLIASDIKNGTTTFMDAERSKFNLTGSASAYARDIRNDLFEIEAHKYYNETGKVDNFTYSGFKATAKRLAKENQVKINSSIKQTSDAVLANGKAQEEEWVSKNKKILMNQINDAKVKMDALFKDNMETALASNPEAIAVYNDYSSKISATTDAKEKKRLSNEMMSSLKKYPTISKAFSEYEGAMDGFVQKAQANFFSEYAKQKQQIYDNAVKDLQAGLTKSVKDVYKSGVNNDLNTYEMSNKIVNSKEFKEASFYGKRKLIADAWDKEKAAITAMVKSGNISFPKTDEERGKHWSQWTGRRPMTAEEKNKWNSELANRTGNDARSRFIFYAVDDLLYNPKGKPTVYAIQSFAREQLNEINAKKKALGIKDYDEVIGGFGRSKYAISQEEAKQMVLTEQYLNKIINTPETDQGTWTELTNGFSDGFQIPFLGAIIGIQQKNTLMGAVDRYQGSSMDTYDISLVDAYAAMNKLAELKPNSAAYSIGSGLGFTSTFMLEMMALGGLNAMGRGFGTRVTESLLNIGKSSTDDVVRTSVEAASQNPAYVERVKSIVGFISGGMTEGAVNPRAYEMSVERMIDVVTVQESGAYDGLIAIVDRNSGEGTFEAFAKGYGNWIGMSTIERLGAHIPTTKLTQNAAQYLGTSTFMKRAFVGKFMRDYGFKSVDDAADYIATNGIPWSGFAPEMIEEVLQGGWESIITGDDPLFGMNAPEEMGGEMHYMGMTADELKTTAGVVAIFGGFMNVGRYVTAKVNGSNNVVSIETTDENGVSSISNMDKSTWDKYNAMMSDKNLTWKSVAQMMQEDESLSSDQEAAIANVLIQMRGKEILEDESYQEWKKENTSILDARSKIEQEVKDTRQKAYDALTAEQKKNLVEEGAISDYQFSTTAGTMIAEDAARSPQMNEKWNVFSLIYQNEQTMSNPTMTIETEDENGNVSTETVEATAESMANEKKKRRDKKLTRGGARGAKQVAKQRAETEKKKEEEGIQFDMPKAEAGEEVKAGRTRKSSLQQPFDLTQTEQTDDKENITGISGEVAKGQEPIQTEPVAEAGQEEIGTNGVVQEVTQKEIDSKQSEFDSIRLEAIKKAEELEAQGLTNEEIQSNPEFLSVRERMDAVGAELDALKKPKEVTTPEAETSKSPYSDIEQVATNVYVDNLSKNRIQVSNGKWLVKQETTGEVFHSANSLEEAIAWQESENEIAGRSKDQNQVKEVSEKRPQDELIDDYQFYSDELESLEQEEDKTEEDLNRIEELKKNISELEPEIEAQSLEKIKAVRAIENEFDPIETEVSETSFEERKSKAVSLAKKLNKNGYVSDDTLNEVVRMSKDKETTIDDLIYEIETDIRINKSQRLDEVESKYSTAKTEPTTTPVTTTAPVKEKVKPAPVTEETQSQIDALNERINEIYDNGEEDTKSGAAELKVLNQRIQELESGKAEARKTEKSTSKKKPKVEEAPVQITKTETEPTIEEVASEVEETEKAPVKITAKGRAVAQKMIDEKPLTIKDQEYIIVNEAEVKAAIDELEGKTTEQPAVEKAVETKKEAKPKAKVVEKKEAPKAKAEKPKAKVDSDGFVSVESNTRGVNNRAEYDETGKLKPKGFYSVSISEDNKKATVKDATGKVVLNNVKIVESDTGNRFVVAPGGASIYVDRPIMTSAPTTEKKESDEPKTATYKKRVSSFYDPGKKKPKDTVSKKAAEIEEALQYDPKSPEFSGSPAQAGITDVTGKPYARIINDAYDKLQISESEYNALNDFLEEKKKEYYNNKAKSAEEKKRESIENEASEIINKAINAEETTAEEAEALQDDSARIAVEVALTDTKKKKPKNKPGMSASRRRGATVSLPETILTRLQKAFPGFITGVDTDQDSFQEAARATGRSLNSAAIIFEGVVYLNDRVANVNTAMEEFAHIYLLVMRANNRSLYQQGINIVQTKAPEYIDEVMNDPGYDYIHNGQNWEDLSQKEKEDVAFEALSKMIADRGETILEEKRKNPIRTFIKDFWKYLSRLLFGFTKKLDFRDDNIDTYTNEIAKELLRGRPISTITPEDLDNIMNPSIGLKEEINLSYRSIMAFKGNWVASARRLLAANKGVGEELGMKLKGPTRKVAAIENQVRLVVGDLNQSINDYIFVNEREGKKVDRAKLLVDIDTALKDPEFRANFFSSDPVAKKLIQPVVLKMRGMVDALSNELAASGRFGDALVASINANGDMYLHTSYYVFSKATETARKNWLENFSDQDRKEIVKWIYQGAYSKAVGMNYKINQSTGAITISFINSLGNTTTEQVSFNDVDALKEYIKQNVKSVIGGVPASIENYIFNSNEGTIELGSAMNIDLTGLNFSVEYKDIVASINEMVKTGKKGLTDFLNLQQQVVSSAESSIKKKKQKQMNETKKKFLMEIQDPSYNFANTITKQASLLYKSELERALIDTGYLAMDINPASEERTESNWRKVTNPNSELYNKWIPAEIYDMIFGTDLINDKALSKFGVARFFYGASAMTKMALTILSPGSNAANYVSGWFQLAKTGTLPIKIHKSVHKAALRAVEQEMDNPAEAAYTITNLIPSILRQATKTFGKSRAISNMSIPLSAVQSARYGTDDFNSLKPKEQAQVLADELVEMGIINSGIESETLRDLAEFAFRGTDIPDNVLKQQLDKLTKVKRTTKKVGRAVSRAGGKTLTSFADAYSFSDSVFKAMMYLDHKEFNMKTYGEEMRRNGMSADQIDAAIKTKTANQVRMQMPTYDRSPEFLRALSRFPLVGPFVQFDFQNKINDKNILLDGGKMMFVDAPRMLKNGMKKEAYSVFAKGIFKIGMALSSQFLAYSIYSFVSGLYGWYDDDDEAMRKTQPEYRSHNALIHMDSNKTGVHTFIDINRVMPQALYLKYWRAFKEEGLGEALSQFFDPYTQPDVFTGAVVQTFEGINKYGVYDKYLAQLGFVDKLEYMLTERLLPSTAYGQIEKVVRAVNGEESMEGVPADAWNEAMNMFLGVKIRSVRLDKTFGQKVAYGDVKDIETQKLKLNQIIKERDKRIEQMERGVEAATPEDIQRINDEVAEEYDKFTTFVDDRMQGLYDLADSYRKLGFTDKQLYEAMVDKDTPQYFAKAVLNKTKVEFDDVTGERKEVRSVTSGRSRARTRTRSSRTRTRSRRR